MTDCLSCWLNCAHLLNVKKVEMSFRKLFWISLYKFKWFNCLRARWVNDVETLYTWSQCNTLSVCVIRMGLTSVLKTVFLLLILFWKVEVSLRTIYKHMHTNISKFFDRKWPVKKGLCFFLLFDSFISRMSRNVWALSYSNHFIMMVYELL